jgi:branched-chain amino acid transport system substrate-binding protein
MRSFVVCLTICGLLLTFSGPGGAVNGDREPIWIGGSVSMQGKYEEPSRMIRLGYELWAMQVNARGGLLGRPVKLKLFDDESSPDKVKAIYLDLLQQEHVDLLLSPYPTPLTMQAAQVADSFGFVLLACGASGNSLWDQGFTRVFGMYAPADRYFIGYADLLARAGIAKTAIVYEDSLFCRDAAKGARSWSYRFGVEVDLFEIYPESNQGLARLLERIRARGLQSLILCAYPPQCYEALHLMSRTGSRPRAVAMTIAPVMPDFFSRGGQAADGVFGPSQWEPSERIPFPGTEQFISDFKAFADMEPSYHAGSAYAACELLESAVRHLGTLNQQAIRSYISSLDTVTVIGRFKVDHTGKQVGHNPIVIQWQEGDKEIVYPSRMQTAQPRFGDPEEVP